MLRDFRGCVASPARRCRLGLFFLVVLACSDAIAPLPDGAIPFAPPSVYRTWWNQVEACSGKTGSFDSVEWFYIPGVVDFTADGQPGTWGQWITQRRSITLAGQGTGDPLLIRHEELHAILNTPGHPDEYFIQ